MVGSLGFGEMVVIFAVMLLLVGAKRVPEVAKSLGKSIREFKNGMNSAVSDIEENPGSQKPEIQSPAKAPLSTTTR